MTRRRVNLNHSSKSPSRRRPAVRAAANQEDMVDRAVVFINKKVAETIERGAQGLLDIGHYVFIHFFHGDVDQVHFRGRAKELSFRRLASHPDLQIAPTGLYNAVHLAVQERQLAAASVPTSEHVLISHKVELLRLPSMDAKRQLLAEITRTRMSVRTLRTLVDAALSKRREIAYVTPPAAADVNGITQSVQALLALNVEHVITADLLRSLSDADRARCVALLHEAEERIKCLIRAMGLAA